jgi:hypothetical protein
VQQPEPRVQEVQATGEVLDGHWLPEPRRVQIC